MRGLLLVGLGLQSFFHNKASAEPQPTLDQYAVVGPQPIYFNSMRCNSVFPDSYVTEIFCKERAEQIAISFAQLEEWERIVSQFYAEPVGRYFHAEVSAFAHGVIALRDKMQNNITSACTEPTGTFSAEQENIENQLSVLSAVNKMLHKNGDLSSQVNPVSKKEKKKWEAISIKIAQWEILSNQFLQDPVHFFFPEEIKKIQADITQTKKAINCIQNAGRGSIIDIATLHFSVQKIQAQINRLTALNTGYLEQSEIIDNLNPGKEVMVSCYNYLSRSLSNRVYATDYLGPDTRSPEPNPCIMTDTGVDPAFFCSMTSKVQISN